MNYKRVQTKSENIIKKSEVQTVMVMEEVIQINGYNLHLIPTKKFKTINMVAKFKAPLNKKVMTKRALLPYLIQQGPKEYPSRTEFQAKLDDLYGAALSIDGAKKGDYHIMSFRFEVANQHYIKNESSILGDSINLFNEIIFNPNVADDAFDSELFKREKETLKRRIRSIEDDKMSYANMRLIDEMCKNERYRIHVHGYEEELEQLTAEELYEYYKQMIQQDNLDIFLVGDFDKETMTELFTSRFKKDRSSNPSLHSFSEEEKNSAERVKEITESQSIQQAKLHIGYRTNVRFQDDDYFALHVFNGIFGSFPSSKLFLNVREKHSLAYYASSRIESHKGLLIVFSGIAPGDYEKAREIIEMQMIAMKKGDFTNDDLSETKELIVNQLLETLDNPQGIIEMLYQQVIAAKDLTPDELIRGIKQVTKDEVTEVANKINEDTVYLLTSEGENSVG